MKSKQLFSGGGNALSSSNSEIFEHSSFPGVLPIKSTKTSSFTKIRTVNIMNSRGRDVCRGSSSFL
jgi:hypothetical protein